MEHIRGRFWRRTQAQILAIALVVYWAVLCVGTHVPGGVIVTPPTSDKVLHAVAYLGLTLLLVLLSRHLGWQRWRLYAGTLLIASCYGAMDELGQILVPGRNADVNDWAADVLGAVAGLTLYWLAVSFWAASARLVHAGRNEVA